MPPAHRMLFVRDLLRCEELPADAPAVAPALRCFVFGNPPERLERVRVLGNVVMTCAVTAADGAPDTLVYLDDASGLIPVVLPRHAAGAPGPGGPSVVWRHDPAGPQVGDCIDVFGTLHSGQHAALADVDAAQRYVCAASWVKEGNALQESSRALEIQQLCACARAAAAATATYAASLRHRRSLTPACPRICAQISSSTFATG
eukprot:COSAG06_NODE_16116_length_1021_cov_1.686551_2_plen_203_part_00